MAIKDNITVTAGKPDLPVIDVATTATIKHASTGKVYATEEEAQTDVNDPATNTIQQDIKRDVAISVNKLPDIFGGTS
tara:strand:- start:252 stop:485 length:234 start_codon:yes stop_codon:yes gene_type:complete